MYALLSAGELHDEQSRTPMKAEKNYLLVVEFFDWLP